MNLTNNIKKVSLLVLLLNVVALLQAGAQSNNGAVTLKFNLQQGKSYVYTIHVVTEGVSDTSIHNDIKMQYKMVVTNDSAGFKQLDNTYERVAMTIKVPAIGRLSFDSDAPDTGNIMQNPLVMMSKMFHAMIGKKVTMKVSPEGEIISVVGFTTMGNDVMNSLGLPEELKPQVEKAFSQQFNDDAMKSSFESAFNIFPGHTVKKGESWVKKIDMPIMGNMQMNTTYTLRDIQEKTVSISCSSAISVTDIKGVQTGNIEVDIASGMMIKGVLTQQLEGKMKMKNTTTITSVAQ